MEAAQIQLRESIIKTLLYSDIFDYPLTAAEVYSRLDTNHTTEEQVGSELEKLRDERLVFESSTFFSVRDLPTLAERRIHGNRSAEEMMPFAVRRAKLIHRFPFVRAVMISGSLSKNFMDDKSDFDYFVVTEVGRLWIARASMALFKRIFLGNSRKFFCVNYFIDSDHLTIEEKNIFTATELSTVIPVCGTHYYHKLVQSNTWLTDYFPNFKTRQGVEEHGSPSRIKSLLERLLNLVAAPLDRWLMNIAYARWKRQYGHQYPESDFNIAFKTAPHVSKNHPRHFQKRVTELYESKVARFFESVYQH